MLLSAVAQIPIMRVAVVIIVVMHSWYFKCEFIAQMLITDMYEVVYSMFAKSLFANLQKKEANSKYWLLF